jgi:dolichol kinase
VIYFRLRANRERSHGIGFASGAIFALFAMPVPGTIFVVVLATLIESLPIRVNDNIVLPVVSSLLYFFMI